MPLLVSNEWWTWTLETIRLLEEQIENLSELMINKDFSAHTFIQTKKNWKIELLQNHKLKRKKYAYTKTYMSMLTYFKKNWKVELLQNNKPKRNKNMPI